MNIVEKNKLISEFMGMPLKVLPNTNGKGFYTEDSWDIFHISDLEKNSYHDDWKKLITVVQKIDTIGYNVQISRISCKITPISEEDNIIASFVCGDIDKKIEIVYDTVVAFIKWYNNLNAAKSFLVNGYFKDDKAEFTDYLIRETDEVDMETDEDVFFYGLSEKEIKEAIELGEDTVHDFVITSYTLI